MTQPASQANAIRTRTRTRPARSTAGLGLTAAIVSAAAFGTSGAFGQPLLASGWSPAAVVFVRLALASAVLAGPALVAVRNSPAGWWTLRRHAKVILGYGLIAVAGCQLFYFCAIERISVPVALLLEYTSPLILVVVLWITSRKKPGRLTLGGCGSAMLGLAVLLNVFGGVRLDLLGVGLALLAAGGNAFYFFISARNHQGLSPLVLATGGLIVGSAALGVAGLVGLLPFEANLEPTVMAGRQTPFWLPIIGLALIAAALAYVSGIVGTRHLGPQVASAFGLSEVLFAVAWAWLLVGQVPTVLQAVGGLVVLGGVALIKADDLRCAKAALGGHKPSLPSAGRAQGDLDLAVLTVSDEAHADLRTDRV